MTFVTHWSCQCKKFFCVINVWIKDLKEITLKLSMQKSNFLFLWKRLVSYICSTTLILDKKNVLSFTFLKCGCFLLLLVYFYYDQKISDLDFQSVVCKVYPACASCKFITFTFLSECSSVDIFNFLFYFQLYFAILFSFTFSLDTK